MPHVFFWFFFAKNVAGIRFRFSRSLLVTYLNLLRLGTHSYSFLLKRSLINHISLDKYNLLAPLRGVLEVLESQNVLNVAFNLGGGGSICVRSPRKILFFHSSSIFSSKVVLRGATCDI